MKITVDVDCTPEEARTFLGLPDLKPMQDALLSQLQDRLTTGLQATDMDTLTRTWMPSGISGSTLQATGLQSMDALAKAMMANLDAALGRETRK